MTDHDNLRNRLKSRICQQTGCHIDDAEIAAQAIIDDLGLTVETHAATHAKRSMTRTIGAWEWNNQ